METCRCDERRAAVKDLKIWTMATLHPIVKRIPVPPEGRLAMKENKCSHDDYRNDRPVVLTTVPRSTCPEKIIKMDVPIPNRWIPVLPGLISTKLVRESRGLSDRPF